jgi:Putative Flp pilus-assembly TadE/G-like
MLANRTNKLSAKRRNNRGATLAIIAGGMVLFLTCAGLAIDLVGAYVARNEAQRIADAAALAGASIFQSQGCATAGGCTAGGPQEALATTQANAVAGQNFIFGTAPTVAKPVFSYPGPYEPQITVTVSGTAPSFFCKAFNSTFANGIPVSAFATAEAYSPIGGAAAVGTSCVKPLLVPNCDPGHPVVGSNTNANPNCPTVSGNTCTATSPDCMSYFFYPPGSTAGTPGAIVNNFNSMCSWNTATHTCAVGTSAVGEPWQLHDNAGPSQWYSLQFAGESKNNFKQALQSCAFQVVACNDPMNALNGAAVGPTDQGVEGLINASGDGINQGQDSICDPAIPGSNCPSSTTPFYITGGSGNLNGMAGKTFQALSSSSSVASVAVYDGCVSGTGPGTGTACAPLGNCQGNGCPIKVEGFMTVFFVDAEGPNGNAQVPSYVVATPKSVDVIIMQVGGCGTTKTTGPPVVEEGGGTFVPIRLIHK